MKDLTKERLGETNVNNQGCEMTIIDYKDANHIVVKFHDEYKACVNTKYEHFKNGGVKNPYYPNVYGVGMCGNKYPIYIDGRNMKEYDAWRNVIQRSYDPIWKKKWHTYQDVSCSAEWLLYDNFYEWITKEDNYDKWKTSIRFCVDKDIINKHNKIYAKENCVLVPPRVNALFTKANILRGDTPIGVMRRKRDGYYVSQVELDGKKINLGSYKTPEDAFYLAYKPYKEAIIKQVATDEYSLGNISQRCYDAMMKYEVEITD